MRRAFIRRLNIMGTFLVVIFASILQLIEGKSPDWPAICPDIVSKEQWGARLPIIVEYAVVPIKFVIIHHTVTPECSDRQSCSDLLKSIQNFHMDTMEFHDIGYNFIVGGDGKIYEGVGWHKVGAHTRGYNTRSLSIAFLGNYNDQLPNDKMLKVAKAFLECGVELKELDKNYKLFGARQVSATLSPGTRLYRELGKWPHFVASP